MKLCVYINSNKDDIHDDCNNENEFLSHPSDDKESKHSLLQHSIDVAQRTRELLSIIIYRIPKPGTRIFFWFTA